MTTRGADGCDHSFVVEFRDGEMVYSTGNCTECGHDIHEEGDPA